MCECNIFLYTDGVPEKETNRIQEKLGEELVKVKEWPSKNKLLLHIGKTESYLFESKFNLCKVDDLAFKVDGYVLANRTSAAWLLLIERRLFQKLKMVYKITSNRAPVYFNSYFLWVNVKHRHFYQTKYYRS